jgi:RNA polymerase sigma-70 factor (ECF subfamily)
MSAHVWALSSEEWERLGRKVDFKIRVKVGYFCSDVEDLVQETLTRFQRALSSNALRNPESVGAFLSGICNNVILEYRRRVWREVPYDVELHPEPSEPPKANLLEIRNSIDAALEQLSDRNRQVLTAFYLREIEKDEICREMSVTDAQFRIIIFRAKDRLRKLLSAHERSTRDSARRL